jgi:hypothetical protein
MADSYIDPQETQVYGLFARDQMKAVCLGMIPELDATVQFAIKQQVAADKAMAAALAKMPAPVKVPEGALDEARDLLVRFGKHLESLKGRPLALSTFYGREAPSVVARRRVPKLVGVVQHILNEITKHADKIRDADGWTTEFHEAHKNLDGLDKQTRASKVDLASLRPELAQARTAWLAVYSANKRLIEGLLLHAGKADLMPLIFDDLAEVHRTRGTSDDTEGPAEPQEPDADEEPPGGTKPT